MTTHSLYAWKMKYGPDSTEHQEKTATETESRRRIVRGLGFERLLFPKADVQTKGNWTKLRSAIGQKRSLQSIERSAASAMYYSGAQHEND
jgi:hypothetical protein